MSVENIGRYPDVRLVKSQSGAKRRDVLISRDEIGGRLEEVAEEVADYYKDKNPLVIIGVMSGALTVVADFRRMLYDKGLKGFSQDSIQVETYGAGTTSSGIIRVKKDLDADPAGKHVLIVDDIVDTGRTLDWLTTKVKPKAESVESFALLSKPSQRKVNYEPKFIGFEIDNVWVEGYGMDSYGYGRENPDIIIGPSVDVKRKR